MTLSIIDDGLTPMRITARLTEPIVYQSDGMHIDGPLAYAAFCALDEDARYAIPPMHLDWAEDMAVPLARWTAAPMDGEVLDPRLLIDGMIWGWCASSEEVEWLAHGAAEVRKKPVLDEMRRYSDAKSAMVAGGPMKGYNLTYPTTFARSVSWSAIGDIDRVKYLLTRHVPALGKKRGHGWGTVAAWDVVEDSAAASSVFHRDGIAARSLPRSCGLRGRAALGSIRPPYHHRSRRVLSVEPEC